MIISSIGYGYLAKYLLKELCYHGAFGIGITSKKNINFSNQHNNIKIYDRDKTPYAISFSTHLLITAPPYRKGCPVLINYSRYIKSSNVKCILYISTTGVYGNHKGSWVNEKSKAKSLFAIDKNRLKAEREWMEFCKKNKIILNILRVSGIYGPERINNTLIVDKRIVVKKNHYFSRIHISDISRIISKIIFNTNTNCIWNLADDEPSTREDYLLEIVRIKKIKKYKFIDYERYEKTITRNLRKYWTNNKKVSNSKVKKILNFDFMFPSYKQGLKNLKDYF